MTSHSFVYVALIMKQKDSICGFSYVPFWNKHLGKDKHSKIIMSLFKIHYFQKH